MQGSGRRGREASNRRMFLSKITRLVNRASSSSLVIPKTKPDKVQGGKSGRKQIWKVLHVNLRP